MSLQKTILQSVLGTLQDGDEKVLWRTQMAFQTSGLHSRDTIINNTDNLISLDLIYHVSEFNCWKWFCQKLVLKIFYCRFFYLFRWLALFLLVLLLTFHFHFLVYHFFFIFFFLLPFLFLFLFLQLHGSLLNFFFIQEVLSCFHFDIFDSWLLLWRKRVVLLFLSSFGSFSFHSDLFEFR